MWTLHFDVEDANDELKTTCEVRCDGMPKTSIELHDWEPGVYSIEGTQKGNVVLFRYGSDLFAYHVPTEHLQCLCNTDKYKLRYTAVVPDTCDLVSFCDKAWGQDLTAYGKHGVHIKWDGSEWVFEEDLIGASNLPCGTVFVLGSKVLVYYPPQQAAPEDVCDTFEMYGDISKAVVTMSRHLEVTVSQDEIKTLDYPLKGSLEHSKREAKRGKRE